MESQWIILILAGIIVLLWSDHSARGKRLKQLEAKLVRTQEGLEALRREMQTDVWQDPQQALFQTDSARFVSGAHSPEQRMPREAERPQRGSLERLAGWGFLFLLCWAVVQIASGAR